MAKEQLTRASFISAESPLYANTLGLEARVEDAERRFNAARSALEGKQTNDPAALLESLDDLRLLKAQAKVEFAVNDTQAVLFERINELDPASEEYQALHKFLKIINSNGVVYNAETLALPESLTGILHASSVKRYNNRLHNEITGINAATEYHTGVEAEVASPELTRMDFIDYGMSRGRGGSGASSTYNVTLGYADMAEQAAVRHKKLLEMQSELGQRGVDYQGLVQVIGSENTKRDFDALIVREDAVNAAQGVLIKHLNTLDRSSSEFRTLYGFLLSINNAPVGSELAAGGLEVRLHNPEVLALTDEVAAMLSGEVKAQYETALVQLGEANETYAGQRDAVNAESEAFRGGKGEPSTHGYVSVNELVHRTLRNALPVYDEQREGTNFADVVAKKSNDFLPQEQRIDPTGDVYVQEGSPEAQEVAAATVAALQKHEDYRSSGVMLQRIIRGVVFEGGEISDSLKGSLSSSIDAFAERVNTVYATESAQGAFFHDDTAELIATSIREAQERGDTPPFQVKKKSTWFGMSSEVVGVSIEQDNVFTVVSQVITLNQEKRRLAQSAMARGDAHGAKAQELEEAARILEQKAAAKDQRARELRERGKKFADVASRVRRDENSDPQERGKQGKDWRERSHHGTNGITTGRD